MKNFNLYSNQQFKNKLQMESTDKSNKSFEELNYSKNSFGINNEEFKEVLKQAGLSFETYMLLSSNKIYSKLTDTIELMFRLIIDKNMTIKILEIENENLNEKNAELNEENISILSKKNNESMINNTSKITINNLNINSLRAYKNFLKKNESTVSSEEDTNSIVNMKTTQNLSNKAILEKNKSYELRRNENILTLESSITSSEFGRDCKGFNSFASSFENIDEGKL